MTTGLNLMMKSSHHRKLYYVSDLPSAARRIRALEKKLADPKQDLADYLSDLCRRTA
jgi:hypothetical protein